jgi:hypothetical protein
MGFDLTPAPHEMGQSDAWNAVGEQEIQVLLQQCLLEQLANLHHVVTQIE